MLTIIVGTSLIILQTMLLLLIAIVLVVCHIAVPSSSTSSISASFAAAAASESTASLARIVPPSLSLRGNRKSNSTGNNNNNNNNNIIAAASTNKNRSSTSADEEVDDTEDEPPNLEWFVEDTANFQQKFHVGNGRVFNDNEVKIIEFLMQSYTSNFVLANNLTSICPQLLYQHQQNQNENENEDEDEDKDDETATTARTAALATLVAKSGNHTTSNNETTTSSSSMNGRVSVPLLPPSSSELQEIIDDTISCECTVNSIKDEIPPPDETAAFTTSTTATVNSYVPSAVSSSASSSSSSNTITRLAPPSVLPVGQVSEFVNVVTYAARYASFICNMRHYTYLFQQYVNGHRQEVMDDLQKLGLDITGVEMAARIVDRGPPSPQPQQDKQDDP